MKSKYLIFILLTFNLFFVKIYSTDEITRKMVIDKAEEYTKNPVNWTVSDSNILDIRKYYVEISTDANGKRVKKNKNKDGQDSIDDRMEFYIDKDGNEQTVIKDTNKIGARLTL